MKFLCEKLQLVATDADVLFAKRLGKKGCSIDVKLESQDASIVTRKMLCPKHVLIKYSLQFHVEVLSKKRT